MTPKAAPSLALPRKGEVNRYLFTCAQNNTMVNEAVWTNLQALAKHYHAPIFVSRFTYITASHQRDQKPGARSSTPGEDHWYDLRIMPHVHDSSMRVAPGLVWCGEVQILPTAKRPISGFESYTGRDSCILPHVKFAMESVASGKNEATKFVYTTGTVTKQHYINMKVGLIAQFHHGYGALLVEVDSDGSWWCRQVNADAKGTLHDLDVKVSRGKVTTGGRVEAIVWGDAHVTQADPVVEKLAWGRGGMLDKLRPRHQVLHDVLDFKSRNHHERDHGRKRFERWVEGGAADDVLEEVKLTGKALFARSRTWCRTVVVQSNHDNALLRWLDEADYRKDPRNAMVFLELQRKVYAAALERRPLNVLQEAIAMSGVPMPKDVRFLAEDESYIVCHDANGGIECGMHGHLGVNGGRGSVLGLARMGRKSIVGHSHRASITDGVYVAGTSSNLDLGYNRGPSAWSHSHVVVYPNGKRAIVTMWKGKYRA